MTMRPRHSDPAAAARLEAIVATIPGVVWEAWGEPDASQQRINFVSRYVETMLGYTVDEWLATPNFWLAIVHPDDRERAARSAREAFADRRAHTNEFRWQTKDGRTIWVESHSDVVCDAGGRPIGMRGVTMDITHRKQIEESLREARQRAEAADRAKQNFLARISHELRNPLNAAMGWVELLRSRHATPEARPALDALARALQLQMRLVNDVVEFARLEAGRLQLVYEQVDSVHITDAAIEALRPVADRKRITLESSVPPFSLRCDPARLHQVLINLLGNAIKFTPAGGRVTMSGEGRDSAVLLSVADTGIGIPPDALHRIFEPFEQLGGTSPHEDGRGEGLGLGLAIVREIVELHGGRIEVTSHLGQGTTMRVFLPAAGR